MDTDLPASLDPQQVSLFLDKIDRDRDAELAQIEQQRDAGIAQVLGDARAESRRLFHHSAGQLRNRVAQQRSRDLARLRSSLRRQHWGILTASQQKVIAAVTERLRKAWEDPERQLQWCRFWLDSALQRAGDSALAVTLGQGAAETVRAQIETDTGGRPSEVAVKIDDSASPGLIVEWGDYVLDGRLDSQIESISEAVLDRLSELLPEADGESPR